MQQMFRFMIAVAMAVALAQFSGDAAAQGASNQVQLTDKQIDGFIAAQKDMAAVVEKMQSNADKPIPSSRPSSSASPRRTASPATRSMTTSSPHRLVMAGIDPQSKAFTEPKAVIVKDIEEVKNDKVDPREGEEADPRRPERALKSAPTDPAPQQHRARHEVLRQDRRGAAVAAGARE